MARVTRNGKVIAESDATAQAEANQYSPPDAVERSQMRHAATHSVCGSNGTASDSAAVVDGEVDADAAWCYPAPSDAAANVAGFAAFWRAVKVGAPVGAGSATLAARVGSGRRSLNIRVSTSW